MTVERLDDGEVSTYLVDELRVGDVIELRGPIGGYFVWEPSNGGPVLLIAGGSGVVPLMAMLRARVAAGSDVPDAAAAIVTQLGPRDLPRRARAARRPTRASSVRHTITGAPPPGWTGYARRIDRDMLAEVAWPAGRAGRWSTSAAPPASWRPRRAAWSSSATTRRRSAPSASVPPEAPMTARSAPGRKRRSAAS